MQQMSFVRAWPGMGCPDPGQGAGLILLPEKCVPAPEVLGAMIAALTAPLARVTGVDTRLDDPRLGSQAAMFLMVLPPPGNLDNAFFRVHRRRNDRFLLALPRLKALFPEVDFAEFDFTGHMLGTLSAVCPDRFALVRRALAADWGARMMHLLAMLPPRGVLGAMPQPVHLPYPPLPERVALRSIDLDQAGVDDLGRALAKVLGQQM